MMLCALFDYGRYVKLVRRLLYIDRRRRPRYKPDGGELQAGGELVTAGR